MVYKNLSKTNKENHTLYTNVDKQFKPFFFFWCTVELHSEKQKKLFELDSDKLNYIIALGTGRISTLFKLYEQF